MWVKGLPGSPNLRGGDTMGEILITTILSFVIIAICIKCKDLENRVREQNKRIRIAENNYTFTVGFTQGLQARIKELEARVRKLENKEEVI